MTADVRLGQVRPTRMRRIGARHMIVLPMQQAQVLSVDDVERTLKTTRMQIAQLEQQVARQRAVAADLERQLEAFNALPVERDDDDPEVPQPEPRRVAGERILAAVTPVGFGKVPEGATPVPPPELTAADA